MKGLNDLYFEYLHYSGVSFLINFYMLQGNDLELVLRQVPTLNMNIIDDLTKVDAHRLPEWVVVQLKFRAAICYEKY